MDDVNRPETEEDGIRAEALRRLKVRLTYSALPARVRDEQEAAPGAQPGQRHEKQMPVSNDGKRKRP